MSAARGACAVCGEPVTTRARIEGYQAWESSDGEIVGKETLLVVHPECWLRTDPDDRARLLADAAET